MTTAPRLRPRDLVLIALATVACAACTTASGPPASEPSAPASDSPRDLPTTAEPGGGGGSSGSTGSGIVVNPPGQIDPVAPAPGQGQAKLVRPSPGQKDLRPVAPMKLEASVDGRHVLIKVSWYSGVEPCNVLDSVKVERDGTDIAITPFEGTGPGDAICIEIAELKATIIDLGDLDAGAYRILAPTGDAPPLEITIS